MGGALRLPDAETFQIEHGTRAVDMIAKLKPDLDVAEGLRLIEDMEIEDVADLKVLPGARALLESLPPERWAIVTSATYRLLLGRLKAAELPVPERIISGDMVERGKPDPEPYRRGAELIHRPRRSAWWWKMRRAVWARALLRAAACWACWVRTARRSCAPQEPAGSCGRSKM